MSNAQHWIARKGQPLQGKRLLVLSYGGVGDQLQYARYLHALDALGCASVTVVVPSPTSLS